MHDRPSAPFDWSALARYAGAYGGLAIIGYFCYELVAARHLDPPFKFGALAVIVAIAVVGALAVLQRDDNDDAEPPAQRLYTAEEVAALLEAMRANGRLPAAPEPAGRSNCVFCATKGAEVRGLDGTWYHRSCFQRAYREHDEEERLRRRERAIR